jgi:hypothetical protein
VSQNSEVRRRRAQLPDSLNSHFFQFFSHFLTAFGGSSFFAKTPRFPEHFVPKPLLTRMPGAARFFLLNFDGGKDRKGRF